MKAPDICPANAYGYSEDNFYVFFNSSSTSSNTPTVLTRWDGERWHFIDRYPGWVQSESALHRDGTFLVAHPDTKTLLQYSPDHTLESKLRLDFECAHPVDLKYAPDGSLYVLQTANFYFRGDDHIWGYLVMKRAGHHLEEFRFGSLQSIWTWTFDDEGTLWATGFRSDDSPILFRCDSQAEINLPIEPTGDMLNHKLWIGGGGKIVLTVPFGEIYAGNLADLSHRKDWLRLVGKLRPVAPHTFPDDLTVSSICEIASGEIFLGYDQGLGRLRGNELLQEFEQPVDCEKFNPIRFQFPFVALTDVTVVCRWDGVHIMRDGQPDTILPSIDPEWFKRKGPSSKATKATELKLIRC